VTQAARGRGQPWGADRNSKLRSGVTSEYGNYVNSLRGPPIRGDFKAPGASSRAWGSPCVPICLIARTPIPSGPC
jgi:hypothetical protein